MKITKQRQDVAKVEEGAWVDNIQGLDDLRLKVRGQDSKGWRKLQNRLIDSIPRAQKIGGRIEPETMDRINNTLLIEVGVLDWGNVEDDTGPVAFSKDKLREYLENPEYVRFRDGCLWATTVVGEISEGEVGDIAKN